MDAYMSKPFSKQEMLELISRILDGRSEAQGEPDET
jgi:hypothetical protein